MLGRGRMDSWQTGHPDPYIAPALLWTGPVRPHTARKSPLWLRVSRMTTPRGKGNKKLGGFGKKARLGVFLGKKQGLACSWEKSKAWRGSGKKGRLGAVPGKREGLPWFREKSKAWPGSGKKGRLAVVPGKKKGLQWFREKGKA